GGYWLVARGGVRFDRLVQVGETDLETLEDVGALLRALQIEPCPAEDDVAAVVDEELQGLLQAQHDRTPLDDRQHDHAKGRLQSRVLVKVVQHSEDLRLSLQLDQDAHAVAVRLVAQVGYAFELALGDELGDLGHEAGLVDRVRQLVDDDPLAPVCGLLERMSGTDDDPAMAG